MSLLASSRHEQESRYQSQNICDQKHNDNIKCIVGYGAIYYELPFCSFAKRLEVLHR
jgi:hypothetical protein